MALDPNVVHDHLTRVLQARSLDAVFEFFDALGYRYADELPLVTRNWPEGAREIVQTYADQPIYLAAHRDFYVISVMDGEHLDHEGRETNERHERGVFPTRERSLSRFSRPFAEFVVQRTQ